MAGETSETSLSAHVHPFLPFVQPNSITSVHKANMTLSPTLEKYHCFFWSIKAFYTTSQCYALNKMPPCYGGGTDKPVKNYQIKSSSFSPFQTLSFYKC